MTAVLLTPLTGQFFDNNGNPLNGGLVYSYVAGTSFGTPQATYTNALGTTPATNPVVLNSAGRADIWGAGTYDFKITDSVGNIIDTISSVTAIFGSGDMTKAVYDPANVAQQLVGLTAVQTITNKTFAFGSNTFTGVLPIANGGVDQAAWVAYTPVATAQTGTITTYTATGFWKQIGKTVFMQTSVIITNAGSGAGSLIVTLPATATTHAFAGTSFESQTTGTSGAAVILSGGSTVFNTRNAAGSTFITSTATIITTITYEVP